MGAAGPADDAALLGPMHAALLGPMHAALLGPMHAALLGPMHAPQRLSDEVPETELPATELAGCATGIFVGRCLTTC